MPAALDRTGKTYGSWTFVRRAPNTHDGRAAWHCKCVCGNEKIFVGSDLQRGHVAPSCGCHRIGAQRKVREDRTGRTYGFLKVISRGPDRNGTVMWNCVCSFRDCGKQTVVSGGSLQHGGTRSCGCYHLASIRDRAAQKRDPNGVNANRLEYNSYSCAMRRCTNPARANYEAYGGRGISFSPLWLGPDGFQRFLADVGPRPSKAHTLHRKHNDGNYERGNVVWSIDHTERNLTWMLSKSEKRALLESIPPYQPQVA